jgi:hypothetical protein
MVTVQSKHLPRALAFCSTIFQNRAGEDLAGLPKNVPRALACEHKIYDVACAHTNNI